MSTDRSPMLVACRKCEHVWPLVWTPCPVDLFVKFKRPHCPSCGAGGKSVVMASRKAGHLDRYVQLLEAELTRAKAEVQGTDGLEEGTIPQLGAIHRAPSPEGYGG